MEWDAKLPLLPFIISSILMDLSFTHTHTNIHKTYLVAFILWMLHNSSLDWKYRVCYLRLPHRSRRWAFVCGSEFQVIENVLSAHFQSRAHTHNFSIFRVLLSAFSLIIITVKFISSRKRHVDTSPKHIQMYTKQNTRPKWNKSMPGLNFCRKPPQKTNKQKKTKMWLKWFNLSQ